MFVCVCDNSYSNRLYFNFFTVFFHWGDTVMVEPKVLVLFYWFCPYWIMFSLCLYVVTVWPIHVIVNVLNSKAGSGVPPHPPPNWKLLCSSECVEHAGLHVYNMDTLYTAPRAGLGTKPSPFSSPSSTPHHNGCIQKTILFLPTPALFFGIGGVGWGGPGIVCVCVPPPPPQRCFTRV